MIFVHDTIRYRFQGLQVGYTGEHDVTTEEATRKKEGIKRKAVHCCNIYWCKIHIAPAQVQVTIEFEKAMASYERPQPGAAGLIPIDVFVFVCILLRCCCLPVPCHYSEGHRHLRSERSDWIGRMDSWLLHGGDYRCAVFRYIL